MKSINKKIFIFLGIAAFSCQNYSYGMYENKNNCNINGIITSGNICMINGRTYINGKPLEQSQIIQPSENIIKTNCEFNDIEYFDGVHLTLQEYGIKSSSGKVNRM